MEKNNCQYHIRVMRNIIYTENEYKCRICEHPEYKECYKEFRPQSDLIKKGRVAFELMAIERRIQ